MKPPSFAPTYITMFPVLAELAQSKGYALAVHGSLQRDMDLVAIPWTDEAVSPEELMMAFFEYTKIFRGNFMFPEGHAAYKPEIKPHGRLAYNVPVSNGAYIDLSIMPTHKKA